jgi:phosphotriesterase-related protein
VQGEFSADRIGITSAHEHLFLDISEAWLTPEALNEGQSVNDPVSVQNAADFRWNAFSYRDNMVLDDYELMKSEVLAFANAGGDCVVELTNVGLSPQPRLLRRLSAESGLKIVAGAGFYVHRSHPEWLCNASVPEIVDELERQVAAGIDGSGVRPGVIGEIGMSGPPLDCEVRCLEAATAVAQNNGLSLHIHVDNQGDYALEHVETCVGAGLDPRRVVCGHMDERLDVNYHRAVALTGAFLAFDTFGSELYFSGRFSHPKDSSRMECLAALIDAGYASQVLLAQDVAVKAHLTRFGGNGFGHLLTRVVPRLRRDYGVSSVNIEKMLIMNPREVLAISRV